MRPLPERIQIVRYKLTLEYNGARYAGWQVQQNARTVQGELLKVCRQVFNQEGVELYGAGRTDAGVHARGQVAHLAAEGKPLAPEQVMMRMNDLLPHDINVLKVEKAHPNFHARHDARMRSYVYQISKRRDAFAKQFVWWVRDPLDTAAMRNAAGLLVGFHDFRSFGDTEKPGASTLVDLTRLEITETADRIFIHISGSHFLWKMVRRIVGVLVEVGRNRLTAADVAGYLENPSREPARLTAPPSGLFLESVEY